MARKIKFRAKIINRHYPNDWDYGFYVPSENGGYLCESLEHIGSSYWNADAVQVDPKTLGQFTGLTDKNGKEIYEGDIFLNEHNEECGTVDFYDGSFWVHWGSIAVLLAEENSGFSVIGNIHENPELLEVSHDQ